jgi:hypothetical protein
MKPVLAASLLCFGASAWAASAKDKDINNRWVDITGGAALATGLIDAQAAALARTKTSQDVILALTPFASQDAGKNAFGIAITPAKTTLLPMPRAHLCCFGRLVRQVGRKPQLELRAKPN